MYSSSRKLLMVQPDHYKVAYEINPWMNGNINKASADIAREQWHNYYNQLRKIADVTVLSQEEDVPDMVFAANGGFVLDGVAINSNFRHPERQPETKYFDAWFRKAGFETVTLPQDLMFEGAGDALVDGFRDLVWLGYGFRTSLDAHRLVASLINHPVLSLRLIDERFYHLDTCFAPLSGGHVMYYAPAFDRASLQVIEENIEAKYRIPVTSADGLSFVCNCTEAADGQIFIHNCTEELEQKLNRHGYRVIKTPMSEFHKAGGSNRCLVLRLDDTISRHEDLSDLQFPEKVMEFTGHLIDHGLLNKAFDRIVEHGGSFETLELRPGKHPQDETYAKLKIVAPTKDALERISESLVDCGAHSDCGDRNAQLVEADMDGVAPDHFYCTTIYTTGVMVNDREVSLENRRMDGCIRVVEEAGKTRAYVTLMRDVRKGDRIVVGTEGVVHHKQKDHGEKEEFSFMSSGVSSERRVETVIEQTAWEMTRIKSRGGRIVIVAGPVVVHTGGTDALCELIRMGYVQALLGGNAIAVHDMERDLYGTSLGVDMTRGSVVEGGHRHHLRTINSIRRYGSIPNAVKAGFIKSGIMKALVEHEVPYVLAGSIRDDGPLPDTVMDLVEAQRQYARHVQNCDMVLMLSSMLHSIGTGNMCPAGVRMICVDINPAVVSKLADRGSLESIGVVTDVGLFLKLLVDKINSLNIGQKRASNPYASSAAIPLPKF